MNNDKLIQAVIRARDALTSLAQGLQRLAMAFRVAVERMKPPLAALVAQQEPPAYPGVERGFPRRGRSRNQRGK